jgi:hypothetical protein
VAVAAAAGLPAGTAPPDDLDARIEVIARRVAREVLEEREDRRSERR